MKASPAVQKAISALINSDLSMADRSLLISAVLARLDAIPLRDILVYDGKGKLFVNGREAGLDEANQLRESAMRLIENKAFNLIREQVVYSTFVQAAHKASTPEDLVVGKGALWWGQQEDKYIKLLLGE